MGPFEIGKAHVSGLNDVQLRELADRLLKAEAMRRGIPPIAIAAGGNQTAGDGGVDASIDWTGDPEPVEWLPRRLIFFQCKAEAMASANLTKEMQPQSKLHPEGELRPIFAKLAASDGAYIVFSTDDPSHSGLEDRLKAMRTAVTGLSGNDRIHFDFYGADRISRWANQHPGVALWLLAQSGRSLGGWQPYGDWSAPGSSDQPYLFDDSERAAVGATMGTTASAVAPMRGALGASGGAVRLLGRSGMGKTRLAEALFDERIDVGPPLAKAKAIYADLGHELETGATRVAEELVLAGVEAVLVVDNCAVATHGRLAAIAQRPGSQLSLLTIDYEMAGEKPAGLVVTLDENSELVVQGLLEQRVPSLSDAERRHLAEFSGGNARIALKIAESAEEGVDLSRLNDSQLLDRLFQTGRQEQGPHARICADAAALVHAFYVEAGDGQEAEHPMLAGVAGVGVDTFYRNVATFLDWGIVQQRGPQRAVMPPPLANMLAAPFIRRSDPSTLLPQFLGASPRLLVSFAKRLGQLHSEPVAVKLTQGLLGPGGPFGEPEALDEKMREGLVNIAPASPEAALEAFERSLAGSGRNPLLNPKAPWRQEYAQLLVHLAYEPTQFARALEVLLAFALAEDRAKDAVASKHLLERFWPRLSVTMADLRTRLAFVDRLLGDADTDIQALGVEALEHMLDIGFVSSSLHLTFGAKARLKEWRPSGRSGWDAWLNAAYDRASKIVLANGAHATRAREIVAQHFREHLDQGTGALALSAMRNVRGPGHWDAGWRAVIDGLQFSGKGLDQPLKEAVQQFEKELRPRSIAAGFDAFVLGEPWRHFHPQRTEVRHTRSVATLAKRVGVCLARSGEDPSALLKRAMTAQGQNSAWQFGEGLARGTHEIETLWTVANKVFAGCETEKRNPRVLAGILQVAARRFPERAETWLDAAVADSVLAPHIVTLQLALPLDAAAMARFSRAVAGGAVPLFEFSNLQCGGATGPVPADALARFLAELYESDGGVLPAIQTLHMRIFGDRSDQKEVAAPLIAVGRKFLADRRTFAKDLATEDHGIATIAKVALRGDGADQAAIATCRALRGDPDQERYYGRDFNGICAVLMKTHPRAVLDEIVGQDSRDSLTGRFFGGHARNDDDADKSQIKFDEDLVLDWAGEDPATRAKLLAELVSYVVQGQDGLLVWAPFALRLIDLGPDPIPVLGRFERRFFTGSWSGSFSSRFVRRRPLVAAMMQHADERVRRWAHEAGQRLEDAIRRYDERDRDRDSRFE